MERGWGRGEGMGEGRGKEKAFKTLPVTFLLFTKGIKNIFFKKTNPAFLCILWKTVHKHLPRN